MKKIFSMKKKGSSPERDSGGSVALPQGDAPEAVVVREVTAFCESGAPGSQTAGDEYIHLPAIVEAAESSPAAAEKAAYTIRRFLSKDYNQRGYAQYNAIMLARILSDNPGPRFTRHFDAKFVSIVKELLREGRDTSVQQMLRETLDHFENEAERKEAELRGQAQAPGEPQGQGGVFASRNTKPKRDATLSEDKRLGNTLLPLVEMWRKEKGKDARLRPTPRGAFPLRGPGGVQQRPSRPPRGLPPPDELAARIEEAKTTARLLLQTIQSTPQSELLNNELVKEFADRAASAHKSIQAYANCDNPSPDSDTMLTLIETTEQLNIAMSKHQRAILQARKALGVGTPSPQPPRGQEPASYAMPQHTPGQNVYGPPQPTPPPGAYAIPGNKHPSHGPYSSSPPRLPNTLASPVSPIVDSRNDERFSPPPGPPPSSQRPQSYDYENAYSAPSGPPPASGQTRPDSQTYPPPTSTAAYGVAENPFADDAYAADGPPEPPTQPQQKTYSLFDRASHHINNSAQPQNQNAVELNADAEQRSRPAAAAFQSSPSYIQRQESSANNYTMHGGSPPPVQASTEAQHTAAPVGAVDAPRDTNGIERRMGDLRV